MFIPCEARRRRLDNITVLTRDMNEFTIERQFDRAVSIEMFEHMRNYARLFARVSEWLAPHGKFFMHIFAHRCMPYAFAEEQDSVLDGALWAAFAMTSKHSLRWLTRRPVLAALFGAVGGPIAYVAGGQLGALELPSPQRALPAIGAAWA